MTLVLDSDDDQIRRRSSKHYCRFCKKGFGCGPALGGHMRSHGIVVDDDDQLSDSEQGRTNRRMYDLRTNPSRLKSCRSCEHCGKGHLFLRHGKCASSDGEEDGKGSLSKRKLSEEEDLANCLMMLAKASSEQELEESRSSSSASKEYERTNRAPPDKRSEGAGAVAADKLGGVFECKACKKVFGSHQALGGHRASHKKVKGCYAARLEAEDSKFVATKPNNNYEKAASSKSRVHECSVCHRVFSSGQALGGHKRCHWMTSSTPGIEATSTFTMLNSSDRALDLKLHLNIIPTPQLLQFAAEWKQREEEEDIIIV